MELARLNRFATVIQTGYRCVITMPHRHGRHRNKSD